MKIAITGSTGFVGSYAVDYFSKKNSVFAFNRKKQEIKGSIKYIKWDISKRYSGTINCDIFIHCASDTSIEQTKEKMIKRNVESCKNIIDVINNSGCKHFIYISSSSVYQGIFGEIDSSIKIDRSNLVNSYSLSKYLAEEYLRKNLHNNVKLSILRPRAIYGKGDRVLVPKILENKLFGRLLLPGNGKNKTSITEINDFINTIDNIIENKVYGTYNAYTKTDTYENLYKQIVGDNNLKGIIKIPIFVFKFFSLFNKNKYSYIVDTFSKDKILLGGKNKQ